jgi:PAS domain-containing protein
VLHWFAITTGIGSLYAVIKYLRRNVEKGQSFYKLLKEFISINLTLKSLENTVNTRCDELLEKHNYLQNQINVQNEAALVPMWKANEKGQCVFVNEAFCRLFEKEKHELLGDGWLSVIADNDLDRFLKLWRGAVEAKTQTYIEFSANTLFGLKRVKGSFNIYQGRNSFVEFQGNIQIITNEEIKEGSKL